MTLNEYQQAALKTAGGQERKARAILGVCGEAGELAEVEKKRLRGDYGADEARRRIVNEAGDVLWYLAELCTVHGIELEDVARQNIAKLTDRAERGVIQGEGDYR